MNYYKFLFCTILLCTYVNTLEKTSSFCHSVLCHNVIVGSLEVFSCMDKLIYPGNKACMMMWRTHHVDNVYCKYGSSTFAIYNISLLTKWRCSFNQRKIQNAINFLKIETVMLKKECWNMSLGSNIQKSIFHRQQYWLHINK